MEEPVIHSRLVGSLPVPNVQDLAAKSNTSGEVPERYVRPELDASAVIIASDSVEIPVIDLERLLDPQYIQDESSKLEYACEEWGFFQLINHGVPNQVIEKMKADTVEFFKLPLEQKKEFAQLQTGIEGFGQAFVVSEHQKLDWGDMLYVVSRPLHLRTMRFWPTQPPTFRETLSNYSLEIKKVAASLMEAMAKKLGLAPEVFHNIFKDQPQRVRLNYYPPCPKADKVLGLSPHSDLGGLTVLLQVNDVQGLQIKRDGKWLPVHPLPGAFLVNIGDFLEILTNGRYRSIEHRAIINPEKERISIAAFHNPSQDAMVGPLPQLLKDGKVNYSTMSFQDYMKAFFSAKLDGRSLLENVKIKH